MWWGSWSDGLRQDHSLDTPVTHRMSDCGQPELMLFLIHNANIAMVLVNLKYG